MLPGSTVGAEHEPRFNHNKSAASGACSDVGDYQRSRKRRLGSTVAAAVAPHRFIVECFQTGSDWHSDMHQKFAAKMAVAGRKSSDYDFESMPLVTNKREYAKSQMVLREGSRPERLTLILDGWAIRSKTLRNGSRQTLGVALPGDFANSEIIAPSQIDHDIYAATPLHVAEVEGTALRTMLDASPDNDLAFWRLGLVDHAIQRACITSLGRRNALERMAHFLCELCLRLDWIGETTNKQMRLPLTQQALADAAGMTAVHTNRVIQQLRGRGLIRLKAGKLEITGDLDEVASFDPAYLLNPLNAVRPY